jgi:hypothetical protein
MRRGVTFLALAGLLSSTWAQAAVDPANPIARRS